MPDPRKKYKTVMTRDAESVLAGPNRIIAVRPPEYSQVPTFEGGQEMILPEEMPPAPAPAKPKRGVRRAMPPKMSLDQLMALLDQNLARSLDPQQMAPTQPMSQLDPATLEALRRSRTR